MTDSERPKNSKKPAIGKSKSSLMGLIDKEAEAPTIEKFAAKSKTKYVDMNFKVEEIERAQFKMAANMRGMSSVGLLRELFADYVERKGVVLPQTLDKD